MKARSFLWLAAIALLIPLGYFGGRLLHLWGRSPPIRVGAILPLTGAEAPIGTGMRDAMRLAVDQVNARGGVQGRRVELVVYDEDPDPQKAGENIKKLVDDPLVLGASGHWLEDWQNFGGAVYHDAQLANVIASALEVDQTTDMLRNSPEFFRLLPTNKAQMKQATNYAWDVAGARKPFAVWDESYYATRILSVFREEALDHGPNMPDSAPIRSDSRDFRAIIERIKAMGCDYVLFAGGAAQGAALLAALRAAGVNAPFQFASKYPSEELIRLAGDKLAEGVVTTFAGRPPEDSDGGRAFLRDHAAAHFAGPPGPYGLYAYAGMQVLLAAMERSSLTRPSVVKELRLGQFDSALGKIKFVWRGQANYNGTAIYQVVGGKWKPIFAVDATGHLQPVAGK